MKTVVRILHILLEAILSIIVFSLPFIVGSLFRSKSVSFTYLCGQLLLWAVFQIVAVPCINLRTDFSTLFWIYTGCVVVLIGLGAGSLYRYRAHARNRKNKSAWFKQISPFLIIALLIIAGQMCVYIFGMHLDEDDARWIAEANDALVKNKMLLHNPATGEYIGRFAGEMIKDVFSPWAMYLAWLSRATGIRAVVIAHTVYPPILLGLSYSAYYEIGCQLFADGKGGKSKTHERGIFLLMVSVINLFMAGNVYTQSVFTLTRIWQGKAVVAAVMISTILAIILRVQKTTRHMVGSISDWTLLIVTGISCCLFSGMGIAIGLLLLAIYGLYVVVRTIQRTAKHSEYKWKGCAIRTGLWLASLVPSIVYGLGYFRLKG